MKSIRFNLRNLLIYALILIAFALLSPPISAQTSSNNSSAPDTVAIKKTVVDNCGKALAELAVFDQLVESKEAEIKLLKERVELEKEKFELVRQLADSRGKQAESLHEANNALKDAITAKDAMILNKDKEIAILKKKKVGLMTIIKAVAAGVAIGLAL